MSKFFSFIVSICISFSLNAANLWEDEAVTSPEFTYNSESLEKPTDMNPVQWIDALETERDKADFRQEFSSFENYTKEISATLGGKYGALDISSTKQTYSIIRTRHKFPGKHNMLTDFYEIKETSDLASLALQSAILAIDTLAAKAMNSDDEIFENLWTPINTEAFATLEFVDIVRQYAQIHEKSLFAALDELLTHFLTTDQTAIALAKKVFDIFAPKLTLNKIYSDIAVSSTYKGWTIHGAMPYPINFTVAEKTSYGWLETALNQKAFTLISQGVPIDVYCRSSVADFASSNMSSQLNLTPNTVLLSYVYNPAISEMVAGLANGMGILRLFFTREVNPEITEILRRPYVKTSESAISRIYTTTMKEATKRTPQQSSVEDIDFLISIGNPTVLRHLSGWSYNGQYGYTKDIVNAVTFCRKAADLGDKEAQHNLPEMLWKLSLGIFPLNATQAIELIKEAAGFGHQMAQLTLASMTQNS